MTKKHLIIGGSTATRTLACSGWVKLSEQAPPQKPTAYADEGNLLHDCMEDRYMKDIGFRSMLGRKYNEQELTKDKLHLLYTAETIVEKVFTMLDIDTYICEPFVEIYPGLAGGSIDVIGVSKGEEIILLLDYKFGAQPVSAKGNNQLRFYGLAAKTDKKTKHLFNKAKAIFYCIVQPKSKTPWNYEWGSVEELDDFKIKLDKAIANPDHFQTGPHCDWCPCVKICPKKQIQIPSNLKKLFEKNTV